ncbi:hypothetical protein COB72_01930 [bacterium]|nr:MAG: hypothetical protein COB72_01930 [bacterium]
MIRTLQVAMPGDRQYQRKFIEWLDNHGLLARTRFVHQISSFMRDHFPCDVPATDLESVAEQAYKDTQTYLRRSYEPRSGDLIYYDLEPSKGGKSWLGHAEKHGYTPHDIKVLDAMMRGVQKGSDGMAATIYRVPSLPRSQPISGDDFGHVSDVRPLALLRFDWVWMDLYPSQVKAVDSLNNYTDHRDRIIKGYAILSRLNKPIIPFIFPVDEMPNIENYYACYLDIAKRLPVDSLGIWMNPKDGRYENQIGQLELMLPAINDFLEFESNEKMK